MNSTTDATHEPALGPVSVVVDLELKRSLERLAELDDRSLSATIRHACRALVTRRADDLEPESLIARGGR